MTRLRPRMTLRLMIRLSAELDSLLQQRSLETGRSVSDLVRSAIKSHYDQPRNGIDATKTGESGPSAAEVA